MSFLYFFTELSRPLLASTWTMKHNEKPNIKTRNLLPTKKGDARKTNGDGVSQPHPPLTGNRINIKHFMLCEILIEPLLL